MSKNQYFKMFANSYQRKLNKTLDKHYNEMSKEQKVGQKKQKSKGEANPKYGDIVLDHISGGQVFRQQAPQLFHGQIDSKNKELEDGIKSFSKVPLPPDLRQRKEVQQQLKALRAKFPSPLRNKRTQKQMFTIQEQQEPPLTSLPKLSCRMNKQQSSATL